MPSVAVIIANRNNSRFLPQCLESVFLQALQPAEVIVVDDASTDESRALLRTYAAEGRITLLLNDSVIGVSASRHRAIAFSSSAFVTTLDADDYFHGSDKLARELDAIGGASSGRIGFSDVMRVTDEGKDIGRVSMARRIREGDLSFHIPHLSGFIPRDYVVSRDDYFRSGGFDPQLRLYEDWDLKIRLSRLCTWHYSGTIGTAYRNNPAGLSKAPRRDHVIAMRRVFLSRCGAANPLARSFARARFFIYHSLYLGRPAI